MASLVLFLPQIFVRGWVLQPDLLAFKCTKWTAMYGIVIDQDYEN